MGEMLEPGRGVAETEHGHAVDLVILQALERGRDHSDIVAAAGEQIDRLAQPWNLIVIRAAGVGRAQHRDLERPCRAAVWKDRVQS